MRQILIFLFISISTITLGQKHYFGLQAGLNNTNLTAKESFEDTGMRTGFIGGITYELKFSNRYRIGVDLLYSQQGFDNKPMPIDDMRTYMVEEDIYYNYYNYDYLSIPIKIGYEIGNTIKLIPLLGLVPAFVIKSEIKSPKIDENGFIDIGERITNQKDYVSRFDFRGLVEVAIEGNLSKHIVLSPTVTYKHSLTTFSNTDYFDGYNMRHYGFSVAIGLKYILNE